MIETSYLSEQVKNTALDIFKKIAQAEGQIHGVPLENVHFHEVGAVDSIIDIVGAAILLDHLNVDVIKSSQIPVGSGQIHIDHGIYPVRSEERRVGKECRARSSTKHYKNRNRR